MSSSREEVRKRRQSRAVKVIDQSRVVPPRPSPPRLLSLDRSEGQPPSPGGRWNRGFDGTDSTLLCSPEHKLHAWSTLPLLRCQESERQVFVSPLDAERASILEEDPPDPSSNFLNERSHPDRSPQGRDPNHPPPSPRRPFRQPVRGARGRTSMAIAEAIKSSQLFK
jgi:hypothetical protein